MILIYCLGFKEDRVKGKWASIFHITVTPPNFVLNSLGLNFYTLRACKIVHTLCTLGGLRNQCITSTKLLSQEWGDVVSFLTILECFSETKMIKARIKGKVQHPSKIKLQCHSPLGGLSPSPLATGLKQGRK